MATLNLGRIKPVFRGAWTSGAYVIDDIVTHGNESFICIQAGSNIATSNASYWTKLAAKGADGTDVGTTLTTQGDILYRDGSGLQRLAKGTANQQLRINSGATAPEWATISGGDFVKLAQVNQTSDTSAVSIDGYFTSDYRFYKIFAETKLGGSQSSDSQVQMRFNHGGSAFTGSNYQWTLNESYVSGSANTTQRNGRDNTSFSQFQGTWNLDDATHDNEYYEVTIYNPLGTTTGKMIKWLGSYAEGSNSVYVSTEGMGYLENTTACTGVTFQRDNSNQITGMFTLYGIKG